MGGMINANLLPASSGLSLGSQVQRWLLNGGAPLVVQANAVPYSSTLIFSATSPLSIFTLTLTGPVTSSSLSAPAGILIFQITQDAVGGRTFAWPPNFKQPTTIGHVASQVTMQLFYFDGTSAWPLGPGVLTP
jgi:hypothetical protein